MKMIILLIGGLVFAASVIAHLWVKIKLRPKQDSDIDEIYWEFEETHPELARYNKLSQITFAGIVIGTLLLFLSLAL
ncbi:MAG: hypothetical protein WC770_09125 [Phycisphaerae bacterium]|jgi:hypothetical protein